MYCVKFCDRLRGKFGKFLRTPLITRMSRIRAKPENRSAKQDPKQKRIKERETWCSRGPKPCYRRCLLLETIVLASCSRRARRSSPATFSTQLLSVLSVRSVVTLSLALSHFSKPIFFSSAAKRGCDRRASHMGSIFNSGNQ